MTGVAELTLLGTRTRTKPVNSSELVTQSRTQAQLLVTTGQRMRRLHFASAFIRLRWVASILTSPAKSSDTVVIVAAISKPTKLCTSLLLNS